MKITENEKGFLTTTKKGLTWNKNLKIHLPCFIPILKVQITSDNCNNYLNNIIKTVNV